MSGAPVADWLADMAGVWVERWLAYGGYLIVEPNCDAVGMGMREGGNRFWRSKRPEVWQRKWHDAWQIGRWREMSEMSEYVPGLHAAIVHHVALHGVRESEGRSVMARWAEAVGGA